MHVRLPPFVGDMIRLGPGTWSRYPNNARTRYGVCQLEIHHPKLEPLNRLARVRDALLWLEAVQQGWLGSPAVRLIPVSMLIYKTVIRILALRFNHCIGLDSSGVSIIFHMFLLRICTL
jgi:hypothetical protein